MRLWNIRRWPNMSPQPARLCDRDTGARLQLRLVVAVEQLVARPAGGVLVGHLDRGRAVPLDIDNGDQ